MNRIAQSLLCLIVLLSLAGVAQAADIYVDASCTLAQAFTSANDDSSAGSCETGGGADTIHLPTGGGQTYTPSAKLDVCYGSTITLEGNGNTISGSNTHRILHLGGCDNHSGTARPNLTVRDLTLTQGNIGDGQGGAIALASSDLTVERVSFTNNSAGSGGAIVLASHGERSDGSIATISDSTFTGNTASGSGGAIRATTAAQTLTLSHVTIAGNTTNGEPANNLAALDIVQATVHLRNSILVNNSGQGGQARDCEANLTTNANNYIGTSFGSSCNGSVSGNLMLGALTGSAGLFSAASRQRRS